MAVIFGLIALISFIVASPIAQNDPAPHNIEGKTRFKNFLSKLFNYWFILFLKQISHHQKLDALPVITMPAFVGVPLYLQKPCICATLGVHVNVYNNYASYKFTWIVLIVQICRFYPHVYDPHNIKKWNRATSNLFTKLIVFFKIFKL